MPPAVNAPLNALPNLVAFVVHIAGANKPSDITVAPTATGSIVAAAILSGKLAQPYCASVFSFSNDLSILPLSFIPCDILFASLTKS